MADDIGPFDLPGDDRGVLLVHGFTGMPFDMRFLGERLHDRGMTAVGLCLPGHGTTPAELDRTPWTAWYEHVERELDRLRSRCRSVAVVGQSLGGLLTLCLAARRGADLAAVASLAAPLWLKPLPRALVAALRRMPPGLMAIVPAIPKRGGPDVADPVMKGKSKSYSVFPPRALVQFDQARVAIRALLPEVRTPLLVVHAVQDHTAPFKSMAEIAARVSSRDVDTLTLPRSYHLVSIDLERERVADAVAGFFEARLAVGARAAQRR